MSNRKPLNADCRSGRSAWALALGIVLSTAGAIQAQVTIELRADAQVLLRQSIPYRIDVRPHLVDALAALGAEQDADHAIAALLRPTGAVTNRGARRVRLILFATAVHALPDRSVHVAPLAEAPGRVVLRVANESIILGSAEAPIWLDAILAPGTTRVLEACAFNTDEADRHASGVASLINRGHIQIGWLVMARDTAIDVAVQQFLPVQPQLAEPLDGYPLFPSNVLLMGSHELAAGHFNATHDCWQTLIN